MEKREIQIIPKRVADDYEIWKTKTLIRCVKLYIDPIRDEYELITQNEPNRALKFMSLRDMLYYIEYFLVHDIEAHGDIESGDDET